MQYAIIPIPIYSLAYESIFILLYLLLFLVSLLLKYIDYCCKMQESRLVI